MRDTGRMAEKFGSVDDYERSLPEPTQKIVNELRRRAHRAAPDGVETIAYNMPTVKVEGRSVIHFAAWKTHIAIYPAPEGDAELTRDLEPYLQAKGTLRFPLDGAIPYDLIERVFAAQATHH